MPGAEDTDRAAPRSRRSARRRWARLRSKGWQIGQCAVAAALAWFLANDVFDHPTPFFAPIAAVVSLGTSYGQRHRRVLEVTLGVALGVLVADLLVLTLGSGAWQLGLIVGLSMTAAVLLTSGQLFTTQAGVQAIVVATLVPDGTQAFIRWTDALIGGGVALLAASVVPAAPLRRPRHQAGVVLAKVSDLLRAAANVMVDGRAEEALDLLAEARHTDPLVQELRAAADEGLSVVASSPFRRRHRSDLRRVADLVEPVDKALRSTRVLVRRCAVTAHHGRVVPPSYVALCREVATACDGIVEELVANRPAATARPALLRAATGSGECEPIDDLQVEAILVQLRSVIADLLEITGLEPLEATDVLPPVPRG